MNVIVLMILQRLLIPILYIECLLLAENEPAVGPFNFDAQARNMLSRDLTSLYPLNLVIQSMLPANL